MTVKFRYKGRSFGSAKFLGAALKRDMVLTVDRAVGQRSVRFRR